MTLELALLVTVVFIFSALIKGWSGFGTNLLAMPMLLILGFLKTEAVPIVITVNSALDSTITAPITTKSPLNLKNPTLSTTFFKLFLVNEKPTSDHIRIGK